jgi:hypothetical protein
MGDYESRMEDARIEVAIERALKNGKAGFCSWCGDFTSKEYEDSDTGEILWICKTCQKKIKED